MLRHDRTPKDPCVQAATEGRLTRVLLVNRGWRWSRRRVCFYWGLVDLAVPAVARVRRLDLVDRLDEELGQQEAHLRSRTIGRLDGCTTGGRDRWSRCATTRSGSRSLVPAWTTKGKPAVRRRQPTFLRGRQTSKVMSRARSQNRSSSSDAAASRARSSLSNSARRSPKRWGVELESEKVAAMT
jgi:hypothetical protein